MTIAQGFRRAFGRIWRTPSRLAAASRARSTRRRVGSAGPGIQVAKGVTLVGADHIHLADGVRLMEEAYLWATRTGTIEIGRETYVGSHSWVVANDRISIGANVLIAPFCYIQDTDHGFRDPGRPMAQQPSESTPIVIEDDVWLGAHVVVTRGVTIGHGSVIGAGSVVTRDIPPLTIAGGVPARPIRSRALATSEAPQPGEHRPTAGAPPA